jgi:hypothetical protein
MKRLIDITHLLRAIPHVHDVSLEIADTIRDKIATDIYADLLRETPVDTGQARGGWQMDLVGGQQHIQNAVPYIDKLNNGHSKQAPAGFIDAIVDRHTRL